MIKQALLNNAAFLYSPYKSVPFGIKWLVVIVFFAFSNAGFSQADSLRKPHSAHKASLMSAVLPGLGQAYNKKYWKIPIIYGGFAAVIYSVDFNAGYYNDFKTAYNLRTDGDTATLDNYTTYSDENLMLLRNYYRRNMELSYILGAVLYILNIVDAAVDAHLFDYDVSNDLSMKFQPGMHQIGAGNNFVPSLKITFKLKNKL